MDTPQTSDIERFITLDEAAKILSVSVETLLRWNENNILKPTITHTGEAGYREAQIKQFLTIKQLSQNNQASLPDQERLASRAVSDSSRKHEVTSHKPFSVVSFLSISTIVALLTVTLLTQKDKFNLQLFNEAGTDAPVLASQTGQPDFPEPTNSPLPSNGYFDLATLSANIVTYAQTADLASNEKTPDSVFDNNGNIKGKTTDTDVLAAAFLANGTIQNSNPVKQTVNLNLLLALLSGGLLAILFIYKKQLAYSIKDSAGVSGMIPSDTLNSYQEQKILEVNQKADGSVVLCFQGQEYKVSKPELDSESDQFIERLMWLAKPDVKEIDYDSLEDAEIKLSAPLSKLVTRLGFVGIKRDLFFPRTSKNRVLFRRFLTQKDLVSMNLSSGQISREFSSSN